MKNKPTKYQQEKDNHRIHYGSNSNTSGKSLNKKTNLICSDPNCNYNSRVWIWGFDLNKISVSSYTCPKHGNTMINVGNGSKIPKAGSKERKRLIEKYTDNHKP
mgnify:CR=1 FL=1